jgi:hypothetical protein
MPSATDKPTRPELSTTAGSRPNTSCGGTPGATSVATRHNDALRGQHMKLVTAHLERALSRTCKKSHAEATAIPTIKGGDDRRLSGDIKLGGDIKLDGAPWVLWRKHPQLP